MTAYQGVPLLDTVITFVVTNAELIAIALAAVYAALVAVAKLTPTKADDSFLEKLAKPVDWLVALLKKKKAA